MKCPHSKNYDRSLDRHASAASLHDACAICGKEVKSPIGWIYTDGTGDMIPAADVPGAILKEEAATNNPVGRWCERKHRETIGDYVLKPMQ